MKMKGRGNGGEGDARERVVRSVMRLTIFEFGGGCGGGD